jgi:Uncharacterized protein conserved in bacteria
MPKEKLKDLGYGTKKKKGLVLTGNLTWANGATYKGALKSLKNKIPHGAGVYFFPESEQWTEVGGTKVYKLKSYTGEFKNGVFNGKGTFRSFNDYVYKGQFKNGRFYGKGEIVYEGDRSGEKFTGIFKNDAKVKGKWGFFRWKTLRGRN